MQVDLHSRVYLQVPALAYNVAYAVNPLYAQTAPAYIVLSHTRNLLVNVNSAVNFILYCAVGQKFRRVFLQTFCGSARNTASHSDFMVDMPMTHLDDFGSRRVMRCSQTRRWAGVASVPLQATNTAVGRRTPFCSHPRD